MQPREKTLDPSKLLSSLFLSLSFTAAFPVPTAMPGPRTDQPHSPTHSGPPEVWPWTQTGPNRLGGEQSGNLRLQLDTLRTTCARSFCLIVFCFPCLNNFVQFIRVPQVDLSCSRSFGHALPWHADMINQRKKVWLQHPYLCGMYCIWKKITDKNI